MIIGVDYIGRLGNQMFTYAYVRSLIERFSLKDYHIVANCKRSYGGREDEGFTDSLRHFNVIPYSKDESNLELKYGSLSQRLVYVVNEILAHTPFLNKIDYFTNWLHNRLECYGFYMADAADAASIPQCVLSDAIFVRGFFQDSMNFQEIRSILLEEFSPRYPALEQNRDLYEIIAHTNSVCVSVRCGDFFSPQLKGNFYVCTPQYFQKAISIIMSHVENPTFVFFSDDIKWVKRNLPVVDAPCYYESGKDPVWEKLRLMYSCNHFIISNSTFSWWAQYLGQREGKIVISPSRWYANSHWRSHLIEKSFILIDA